MVDIKKFVFSPFQENTYVLVNKEKECWIIDPGCYFREEKTELLDFIKANELKPIRLINTHCHLDHVFGNKFMFDTYGLLPEYHRLDEPTLEMAQAAAKMYGIPDYDPSPKAVLFLNEGDTLSLGNTQFEVFFLPGHAPGHIALVNHGQEVVIGGDVLFYDSIGRTDLPGGNHARLIDSIKSKLFKLKDGYTVYSGHGEETSIGREKKYNPFLK